MSDFTEGPWHLNTSIFDGEPDGWEVVGRQEGSINPIVVGMLKCSSSKTISKNIKDATLIAAAPEMYEALAEAVAMIEGQEDFNDDGDGLMIIRCNAALAKARGEYD